MRVCWDAEANGRAPCGALSGQNSDFLLISRMITSLPDAAGPGLGGSSSAAGGFALDGELQPERVLERHRGRAEDARLALRRAEIGDVQRSLRTLADEGPGREDLAVADDLCPRAKALPLGARHGRR